MPNQKQNKEPLEMKALDDILKGMDSWLAIREREILTLVVEGFTEKEIASQLNITEQTVRTYRAKLMSRVRDKIAHTALPWNIRRRIVWTYRGKQVVRPPFNAEYILYLLLRKEEREVVIGDLIEGYGEVLERFNKRRADLWFYKQVAGSVWPLLRRAMLKIGAFVWLGRILRRLIS